MNEERLIIRLACSYLRDHLTTIIEMCLSISGNTNYPTGVRSMAADIITVIAQENGGFFRKHSQYLNQYLQIAVGMMMDIDDDENWVNGEFGTEEELDTDNATHVMGCVVDIRF